MTDRIRIRVSMKEDGSTPVYQLMLGDAVAHTFDGFVELVDFVSSATSAMRYVAHDLPARMRP